MKTDKGNFGYLSHFKKRRTLITILLSVVMGVVIGYGYYKFHTMKTIFTVFGILFVLPLAKILSGLLIVAPMKTLKKEEKDRILEACKEKGAEEDQILWDLALSSAERVRHFPYMIISDHAVLAFYPDGDKKQDKREAEIFLRNALKQNAHRETVFCFTEEKEFFKKAGMLSWNNEDKQEADRVRETILVYEM